VIENALEKDRKTAPNQQVYNVYKTLEHLSLADNSRYKFISSKDKPWTSTGYLSHPQRFSKRSDELM
jgi:hypothetical protein